MEDIFCSSQNMFCAVISVYKCCANTFGHTVRFRGGSTHLQFLQKCRSNANLDYDKRLKIYPHQSNSIMDLLGDSWVSNVWI